MIQFSFQFKKDQPRSQFPDAAPRRMSRITWRTLPARGEDGVYRGRITWWSGRLVQAIITHTPRGYDLGWYRLISPAEIIRVKRCPSNNAINLTG